MPNWIDCKLIVEGDTKNFDDFACIRLLRNEKGIGLDRYIRQSKIKDGIMFEFQAADAPPINYVNQLSIKFDLGFRLEFFGQLETWCGEFVSDRRGRYDLCCDKDLEECWDCIYFPCILFNTDWKLKKEDVDSVLATNGRIHIKPKGDNVNERKE